MYGPIADPGIAHPARWLRRGWDKYYSHAYRHRHGRHDNANQNTNCDEDSNSDFNIYIRQYIE
jgi:hypothetical protein